MVSLIKDTDLFMGMSLVDTPKSPFLTLGMKQKQLPCGLTVGVVEQVEETSVIREDKGTLGAETNLQGSNVKHLADMLSSMGSNLSSEQARWLKDIAICSLPLVVSLDTRLLSNIQQIQGLVVKKTRFCIDCRQLNDVMRKDSFPLPKIEETVLSGSVRTSLMDTGRCP